MESRSRSRTPGKGCPPHVETRRIAIRPPPDHVYGFAAVGNREHGGKQQSDRRDGADRWSWKRVTATIRSVYESVRLPKITGMKWISDLAAGISHYPICSSPNLFVQRLWATY